MVWYGVLLGSLVHRLWAAVRAAGAVTPVSPAGYRFRRLGEGTCLSFPLGAVFGEAWIEIGDHTLIGERVSISAGMGPGVDLGPDSIVRIGGGCSIGRGSHIVGHQSIDIGDDVFTGPYVYITDQNHVYDDPEAPIGRQWPRNNPVSIGVGLLAGHRRDHPAGHPDRQAVRGGGRGGGARGVPRPQRDRGHPREGRPPLRTRRGMAAAPPGGRGDREGQVGGRQGRQGREGALETKTGVIPQEGTDRDRSTAGNR